MEFLRELSDEALGRVLRIALEEAEEERWLAALAREAEQDGEDYLTVEETEAWLVRCAG